MIKYGPEVENVINALLAAGGTPFFAGGCVRDYLLDQNATPTDYDIEVYGLPAERIPTTLQARNIPVELVGQSFGVFKVGTNIDISLPRREVKNGEGHRGFDVTLDSDLTIREACLRRDFTMNSILIDALTGDVYDLYGGETDLRNLRLRATSDYFVEDPLRVLRGMQFCGRFGLVADQTTLSLCRELRSQYSTLPKERIWWEWEKWSRSPYPVYGLNFLMSSGWLDFYVALSPLDSVVQDPVWHSEGSVWVHSLEVVKRAAIIARGEHLTPFETSVLVFAALLHDVGKTYTTTLSDKGRVISRKHEQVSEQLAEGFLVSIGAPVELIAQVTKLVRWHMVPRKVSTRAGILRLASRLAPATIRQVVLLSEADRPSDVSKLTALLIEANIAQVSSQAPQPILMGRHLLAEGMLPGPAMGVILKKAYQAQLDGQFDNLDGAIDYYRWIKE